MSTEKNKSTELHIREARDEDLDDIVDFQIRMALETEDLQLVREVCQKGVTAVFENPLLGRYYIASKENTPVGVLLVTYEWSDWRNSLMWWIQSVYVPPEYRGEKIFSRLYRHLQSLVMADDKAAGLRLYVEKENKAAQEIYRHLGMNPDRYRVCEWLKKDER